MDSASAQSAGLSTPAVANSGSDAARRFTERSGLPIEDFRRGARAESIDLRSVAGAAQIGNFRRSLQLPDPALTRAAAAITESGEDPADSLWGERVSPVAGYSGRGSLMGLLRATLAHRNMDRHRRTHRETMPAERDPVAAPSKRLPLLEMPGAIDAEERLSIDPRDVDIDLRSVLQASRTGAFPEKAAPKVSGI